MTHKVNKWVQLEHPRLGSRVTYATDEFFGAKERLIETGRETAAGAFLSRAGSR